MSEQNKALMRRFYDEVFNKGNLGTVNELCAPNFVDHTSPPGADPGAEGVKQMIGMYRSAFPDIRVTVEEMVAEGVKQMIGMYRSAFPDIRVTVEEMVAEGDTVVSRTTMRGTHTGDLMGIPPTGKQVTMRGLDLVRIAGGKATEVWHHDEELALFAQLGVTPPAA